MSDLRWRCPFDEMAVAVSALRAPLGAWLERTRRDQEVVVMDRGVTAVRPLGVSVPTPFSNG